MKRGDKMKTIVLVVSLVLLLACSTIAGPKGWVDGNDVLRDCNIGMSLISDEFWDKVKEEKAQLPVQTQVDDAKACFNYVIGFKDSLYISEAYLRKNGEQPFICLPTLNLNNGVAIQTVLTYLEKHQNILDGPREALMFNAFFYTYPCEK